jgi:alkyl hydroperoxide reductase subunit AhpC
VIHDDRVGRSVDEIIRVLTALQSPGRTFATYTSPEMAGTASLAATG